MASVLREYEYGLLSSVLREYAYESFMPQPTCKAHCCEEPTGYILCCVQPIHERKCADSPTTLRGASGLHKTVVPQVVGRLERVCE
jgi:hypothetical protein